MNSFVSPPAPVYTVIDQNSAAPAESFKLRISALSRARQLARQSRNYAISVHGPDGKRVRFLTDCASL